jgi:hypothetical protein
MPGVIADGPGPEAASRSPSLRERLAAVASLGVQRKPGPDRPWTNALAIEQELLSAADAVVAALGEPASPAPRLDEVGPMEGLDASTAFARVLALGSIPSEAAAEAAVAIFASARPEARTACADALALAPSPAIGAAVVRLLGDAPPALCAAALGVLRFRHQGAFGPVALLLGHPSPAVAAAAARCLGTLPERRAAASVLRYLLSRGPADAVALPAAEALLSLGDPGGLAFVRDKLEAESASPSLPDDARVAYMRLLALAGDAADRELFFRSVEPAPRDATAVGWFGHPDLVEWLLGSLENANETRRSKGPGAGPSPFETAAARALHRILGSPLASPSRAPDMPIIEAARWRAFWDRAPARQKAAGRQKLRFGRPYTPSATLDELEADALPGSSRADAARELAIVSRGAALLETDDWVARQRTILASARALLGGADAYPAGAFPGSRLAER